MDNDGEMICEQITLINCWKYPSKFLSKENAKKRNNANSDLVS
jgi:hypothetical protein